VNVEKPEPTPNDPGPSEASVARWTALLARWIEFARAGAALPAGDEWRRAITPVIELQAVTFALADIGTLPKGDRAMAVDRAGLLVERNERAMQDIWGTDQPPAGVTDLLIDARRAYHAARALLSDSDR
jgi:hypothetical protein